MGGTGIYGSLLLLEEKGQDTESRGMGIEPTEAETCKTPSKLGLHLMADAHGAFKGSARTVWRVSFGSFEKYIFGRTDCRLGDQ